MASIIMFSVDAKTFCLAMYNK